MLFGVSMAILLAASAARGAPALPALQGLLTPDGVQEVVLADYPDLQLVLPLGSTSLELRRPDGRLLRDGELDPSGVTPWGTGSDRRLVRADAEGRIERVTWGSGRRLQVVRGPSGEPVEVLGAGGVHTRVTYDRGLSVEHPLGLAVDLTGAEDGWWTVRDGAARQTRMYVNPTTQRLEEWEDPRGLRTRIRTQDGLTELVGPDGGVWRTESTGETGWLEQPDGHRWAWSVDATGSVTELRTPSGKKATWERDGEGRVTEARYEGLRSLLKRDGQGRVVAWTDPSGAELRLEWTGSAVSRVVDAGGAAVLIERDEAGRAEVVRSRGGGSWLLDRGLDGELQAVVDPVGRTLTMRRDGAGRLSEVDYQGSVTKLKRDSVGRLAAVLAASGARTGFVRDASGRIHKVRQPGLTLTLDRDAAGDVVAVMSGGTEVLIQRDAGGRVLSAGPMRWVRDLLGQVRRLLAPSVDLRLERNIVGRLRELVAGGTAIAIQRGPGGHPVRWSGGGEEVSLTRDAAGRPVAESVGRRSIRLERGARGHRVRADSLRGTWRWSRGADAHVLRVEGPDGAGVGVDRDEAGRVVLGRLPGGGLARRTFADDEIVEALDDAGGGALARGVWREAPGAGVEWAQGDDGLESYWLRDGRGSLLGIEVPSLPESSWMFGSDFDRGPGGWTRALDALGRTTELGAGESWPAWGAVGGAWAYHRDGQGRLSQVVGTDEVYLLEHDAFGRLRSVHGQGVSWHVQWDAMGRPHRIVRPGASSEITWAPGQVVGTPLATGPDGRTAWIDSGTGVRAWSRSASEGTGAAAGLVELPGLGRAYMEDALGVVAIRGTLGGAVRDSAALDPLGRWGGISMFVGGPEVMTGVALEPAAAERTDGTLDWPWSVRGHRPSVLRSLWDDSGWAPEVEWGSPLPLARSLGVVDLPEARGMLPGTSALAWLPDALDQRPCPVGPAPGSLGLEGELEPLVWRIVQHLSEGEGPLGWEVVAGPLIDPSEVGQLPPGLRVPGLHDLDAPPDRLQAPSLEQKVLAGWAGLL